MTEAEIKRMVDRFLSWELPDDFNPDGGISFDGSTDVTGTNLLSATQAEAMIRYITGDE